MENVIKVNGFIDFKIYARIDSWFLRMISWVLGKVDCEWHAAFLAKYAVLKDQWQNNNLITNSGKAQLALLAGDAAAVPFTFIGVGTSSTAPAAAQTALQAEITDSGLERAAGTVSRVTTAVANDTLQITKTWSVSGSKTVEEIGIFNDAAAGTMGGRALTGSKILISGDTLVGTYKVQFS